MTVLFTLTVFSHNVDFLSQNLTLHLIFFTVLLKIWHFSWKSNLFFIKIWTLYHRILTPLSQNVYFLVQNFFSQNLSFYHVTLTFQLKILTNHRILTFISEFWLFVPKFDLIWVRINLNSGHESDYEEVVRACFCSCSTSC